MTTPIQLKMMHVSQRYCFLSFVTRLLSASADVASQLATGSNHCTKRLSFIYM